MLDSSNPRDELRLIAATQLLRMDDDLGRKGLASLTRSPSVATRRGAVMAFRQADNVTLPLVATLADEAAEVRVAAAETMLALL